jgi:hypothetical protein
MSKVIYEQARPFIPFNLETAVDRARWCVGSGDCREATTPRAGALLASRQRQAHEPARQRVRTRRPVGLGINSGLTQVVNVIEARKVSVHAVCPRVTSGQLRFLGSMLRARRNEEEPVSPALLQLWNT